MGRQKCGTGIAGNETTFHYDEPGYPALLTSFVEPDDGQGSGPATTTNTYYLAPYSTDTCDTAGECRHGQIESVTDPNGVLTGFDYDIWGQLAMYGEGTTDGGATFIYQLDMTNDSASRTVATFTSGTASRANPPGGKTLYNPNNRENRCKSLLHKRQCHSGHH